MSVEEKIIRKVNLDEILTKFSIFQRYHLQNMVLIFLAYISNALYSSQYIFVAEAVSYRCIDSNVTSAEGVCSTDEAHSCSQWVYDDPDSFVAQFDLACQEWKRTLVGTVHNFAYMLGLLVVGPMSDKFGRRSVSVMLGVLGGVFGLLRSFSPWYWFFIAMEFLEAFIGDIISPIFVLAIEMVPSNRRLVYLMIVSFGYAVGGLLLGLIAWLIPYWRWFLRAMYAPALLFFFYIFLLDESPRWYLSKGRKDEAIKVLEKVSKKNKVEIDKNMLDNLTYEKEKTTSLKEVLIDTLKSNKLRTRLFVCLVWWTTSTFVNYGLVLNSVTLQGNKYINYTLTQLVDVPGQFIMTLLIIKFRRKIPLMICFTIGAAMCIAQPFVPLDLNWLAILFYMVGKLMSSLFFGITYIFTSELFPTYTRNTLHAFCSSIGRIGSVVAQQTPLLLAYWSGFPPFIFGSAALIAALVTFLVPDVSDDSLPDNIREAEAIGQRRKEIEDN